MAVSDGEGGAVVLPQHYWRGRLYPLVCGGRWARALQGKPGRCRAHVLAVSGSTFGDCGV